MTTRIFGSGIRRREDPRLITGQASYTDDIKLTGMVHAAILRSPHAHARITSINTDAAQNASGVLAVYTGADIEGVLNPIPCAWAIPDSDLKAVAYPAIASGVVRYVGDAVAVVVAQNRYQARGRAGVDRGGLRAAAGHHQPGGRAGRRRAPAPRGRSQQPGVPLGRGRRRHRRRLLPTPP